MDFLPPSKVASPSSARRARPADAWSSRLHRTAAVVLGAAAVTLVAPQASAQSGGKIALGAAFAGQQSPSLPRADADGKDVRKRPQNLTPDGISFQDCIDNVRIRYPLTMNSPQGNDHVEVWAALSSNDCSSQTARQAGANKVCWRLYGEQNVPLQANQNVDIPVREILAGATNASSLYDPATTAACGAVDLTTINVQFLYFTAGDTASPADKLAVAVQADTIGPVAPSGVSPMPGNRRIHVSWNSYGEGGVVSLTGVNVYCDVESSGGSTNTCPDTGVAPVDDAEGEGEDEGDGDASDEEVEAPEEELDASTVECAPPADHASGCMSANPSPNFVASDGSSIIPDAEFDSKYKCGDGVTGNTATSVVADRFDGAPLVNGTRYVVAVAATDAFGNVGPLSRPVCDFPEETSDFWESYKRAGGGGGGGYCSVDGVGLPMGSASVLAIVATTALSVIGRRRRRTSPTPPR